MGKDYQVQRPHLYVQELAKSQKPPADSGRSHVFNTYFSWNDLKFATAQVAKRPVEYFDSSGAGEHGKNINSKTIIGKNSKNPIAIDGPAVAAAMSFGALSENAKIAVAKGTALANTIANTGEGGMLPGERQAARLLIAQYSTGRFGVDEDYLRAADAVEIKYGQGAKPGQGGLLPGSKVTEKIAAVRSSKTLKVEPGQNLHSPAFHHDIKTVNGLKERIAWLRDITGGKPIILKIGACDLAADIPPIVKAGPDIIAIDGAEGGTGASPAVMLHHTGRPTIPALVEARAILNRLKAPQELWIGGGISTGADMAKALALGADLVFVGTALLEALGCRHCGRCHEGNCDVGICTQNPEQTAKLEIGPAAERVANYFISSREEVKQLAAACGYEDIYDLKKERKNLIPLTLEMSIITGLPFPGMQNFKNKYFNK